MAVGTKLVSWGTAGDRCGLNREHGEEAGARKKTKVRMGRWGDLLSVGHDLKKHTTAQSLHHLTGKEVMEDFSLDRGDHSVRMKTAGSRSQNSKEIGLHFMTAH